MTTTEQLGTRKIPGLVISLAIPAIIAQLVNLVYNLVDRMYIGRMVDGTLAMSALAVSLPVVTLITAFTSLVGFGGAPLAAMRLGEGKNKLADKILTNSFSCLVINGVVITVLFLIFQEPLLYAFGSTPENIELAKQYVGIYTLGTICVQFSLGLNPYINTQGQAKFGMLTVVIGAIINIVLDPIFIYVLNMGVKGAALATIISQGVSAVWVLYFFFSDKSKLKIRREYLIPDIKIVLSIMALGISPFIMTFTESFLQISFNNQLSLFGGTIATGGLTILMSFYQMVNFTMMGLCQGAQPVLSYNYGAKNFARVRAGFKMLLILSIIFTFIGYGSVILLSDSLGAMFTTDPDTIRFVGWAIKVYLMGALIFGIQISCQQSFLALGQAKRSLAMALFRKVILLIPLIYILPSLIGETQFAINMAAPVADLLFDGGKVFAVLVAETISDFTSSIVTGILFLCFYKKYLSEKAEKLSINKD